MRYSSNLIIMAAVAALLAACQAETPAPPDFDAALARHLDTIQNRDLEGFQETLTTDETLYMIFPNGEALTTPEAAIELHKAWFADDNWLWHGEVVHKMVGTDMAFALMRYDYRDAPGEAPRTAWLNLVFRLEDGTWRLVHDQNTRIGGTQADSD